MLENDPPALVNFGFIFSFALFGLVWLLFGIAAYRAQVFPRIAVILLMVGAVLNTLPLPFTAIVFAVAVAWMGFSLLAGQVGSTEQQTSRVRFVSAKASLLGNRVNRDNPLALRPHLLTA